ncbi:MAG: amylo-alpha-1,6-glucosidase [Clostridiales bacterium]|jgi:predicted glycogen debranching enzyme|nr:amylo-alpha-1,6-glucosidase [Clostridiales bacterium]
MSFVYGKNDWRTIDQGLENCYLIANGLGGFSSLSIIASPAQNSQALFMACTKAPNERLSLISWMQEELEIKGYKSFLSSQKFANYTKNQEGYRLLSSFSLDPLPRWVFQAGGIEVKKECVLEYGENTLALRYLVRNMTTDDAKLILTPQLQFALKGEQPLQSQTYSISNEVVESEGVRLFFATNGLTEAFPPTSLNDMLFPRDAANGRNSIGTTTQNHKVSFAAPAGRETECLLLYSLNGGAQISDLQSHVKALFEKEKKRLEDIEALSGFTDEAAKILSRSADQFIVRRESTKGKTILAGYPLFEDWGRDTMIAVIGCCVSTRRYEDAKNIFRTFIKYLKDGMMPNIFPEGGAEPLYNTADAALLFITAVKEYYDSSKDLDFVREAWPAMEEIIDFYQKGTGYHIRADEDGLIMAGEGFEQVTWMDVRIGDILPTPRHGKPVEINAYWHCGLMAMKEFSEFLGRDDAEKYWQMAEKAKTSFREKFWSPELGCLKDVLTVDGEKGENQIRCNQIWAVSTPYPLLENEMEKQVVRKVYSELYTPYGLRSLSPADPEYQPAYGGSQFMRDMAYHQGTVWAFPLGGYFLAHLKAYGGSEEAKKRVREQLDDLLPALREGCIGQIAEIYDGDAPATSQGCYAQAWSVGEILRVYDKLR